MKDKDAMKWVRRAVSDDSTRVALCGVLIEGQIAVGCDGRQLRLAHVNTDWKDGVHDPKTGQIIDAQYPNYRRVMPDLDDCDTYSVTLGDDSTALRTHQLVCWLAAKHIYLNPDYLKAMDGDWQMSISKKAPDGKAVMFTGMGGNRLRVAVIMPLAVSWLDNFAPPKVEPMHWEPWKAEPAVASA